MPGDLAEENLPVLRGALEKGPAVMHQRLVVPQLASVLGLESVDGIGRVRRQLDRAVRKEVSAFRGKGGDDTQFPAAICKKIQDASKGG